MRHRLPIPRPTRRPLALALAAAALALLLGSAHAGPAEPQEPADPAAQAAGRARLQRRLAGGGDGQSALARAVEGAWWNEPEHVGRLALSGEQRRGMDALLRKNLEGRQEIVRRQRAAQRELYEALEAGEVEKAAERLDAVERAHGELARAQLGLRVEVARLLTPAQRTALADSTPRLWRQPWVESGRRRAVPARGDRGARRAAPDGEERPRRPARPPRRP